MFNYFGLTNIRQVPAEPAQVTFLRGPMGECLCKAFGGVVSVRPGSVGEQFGTAPGWRILKVAGKVFQPTCSLLQMMGDQNGLFRMTDAQS